MGWDETDYDDEYEDEDDSDSLILSFGEGGDARIQRRGDFENCISKQQDLIKDFIGENLGIFKKFLNKRGISEDDFNSGKFAISEEE